MKRYIYGFIILGSIVAILILASLCCPNVLCILRDYEPVVWIATLGMAIIGLKAWLREFIGKKRIEIAEEAAALFSELPMAIRTIRNPLISSKEYENRRSFTETAAQTQDMDNAYVIQNRWRRERDFFAKLESIKFKFILYYDKKYESYFDRTKEIYNDIYLSSQMLAELAGQDYPEKAQDRKIMFSIGSRDELQKEVDAISSKMVEFYKSLVK